jgi:ribonuclease Z
MMNARHLRIALLAPALSLSSGALAQGRPAPARDSTVVVLLGTGTPAATPDASGPATAVVVGSRVLLFDAGPGVERRLAEAGLPFGRGSKVPTLFVTHLHTDHTLGLPDLIFTSWVMGRRTPLQAYGPRGLGRMVDHLMAAYAEDVRIRTDGLEHETRGGERVAVREIGAGVVYDSAGVRVTAIPVEHGSWPQAFGYRIDTPDRSIVISGDTRPTAALERAARGVDILIHEVYPESRLAPEQRPGGDDWPRYMRAFHTSDVELGRIAARVRPRLLILHHIVRMGGTDAELLRGVRVGGYAGRVVIGRDLDRYR